MLGPNEVPDTPASGVESFACRADGKSALVELWRQSSDSCEWNVEQTVVDFVRENDKVVLYTEIADALQFGFGEDFSDRVVPVLVLVSFSNVGVWKPYGEFRTWYKLV